MGRFSTRALTTMLFDIFFLMQPSRFHVMLLRRLRIPVLTDSRVCDGCGAFVDAFGDYYACCIRTGRIQARARPVERPWKKILHEIVAIVYFQKLLCQTIFF